LRVLLDEMYPPAIAEQLRGRGRDAAAVTERGELHALSDPEIFTSAQQERRAVVTENIADFTRLADDYDARGQPHHGMILVDPGTYPRGRARTIGRMVMALDRLLGEHQRDEPGSLRHWL
jgi:predicted nuclease of predicted toxin-antitoxin system